MEEMEEITVDPVCGTEVDPDEGEFKFRYRNKLYYFCCLNCQLDFEESPEVFLSAHA